MRVYGLSSPVKSQGWLLGLIVGGLVVCYPPLAGFSLANTWFFDIAAYGWRYNLLHDLRVGGVAWHLLTYLYLQKSGGHGYAYGYAYGAGGFNLLMQFVPYCFMALAFPVCAPLLWRRLVDYAERPTILRGMLTAVLALLASLVLIFLLDQVGGRIPLYLSSMSYYRNMEMRDMISSVWITSVVQAALCALPALALGGLLARRQGKLEASFKARRLLVRSASEG